jgi:two-component system, LuxR family, response regulator FixJ
MRRQGVVHVIDDDEAARESLVFLLETEGLTVTSYESAVEFVDGGLCTDSGCIVTDLRMPEMDGIALLRHLRAQGISCPVIVITGHGDIPLAIEAIAGGAFDFIEKPADADVLLAAVRAALESGEGGSSSDHVAANARENYATLSGREQQVFDRLVHGRSNSAIAEELGGDERSVEIHRANIMTRMGVTNLSGLVRISVALK